jgi:dipeptidyl-peptidase 4
MTRMKPCLRLLLATLACAPTLAFAQGSAADYERANRIGQTWGRALEEFSRAVVWLPDGSGVWFEERAADGRRAHVVVDGRSGERSMAYDPARLALALGDALGRALDPQGLELRLVEVAADRASVLIEHASRYWRFLTLSGALLDAEAEAPRLAPLAGDARPGGSGPASAIRFDNRLDTAVRVSWVPAAGEARAYFELAPGEARSQHTFVGHLWHVELLGEGLPERVAVFRAERRATLARIDPQARRALSPGPGPAPSGPRAFTVDDQLHATTPAGTFRLTRDGSASDSYADAAHVSPDGRRVLALQIARSAVPELLLVESAPRGQLQPLHHRVPYQKPGDPLHRPRPRLFDLEERLPIAVDEAPFADAWSIRDVRWAPDSSRVYLRYDRRGHQLQRVYAIDAATGAVSTVLEERSETFIDYSQKTWLRWLDDTGELLWTSERDGWNHVYALDLASGTLRQVTRGEFVVRAVERVDAARRQLWLRVLGYRAGEDPYHAHLARVDLDSGALTLLTSADGTHELEFSPTGEHFLARWSRVDQPWVTELRRSADGALIAELGRDDARALYAAGFSPPQRFVAKGRDGATDIHGILIRPSRFDPARRYPVLESIYAGPHDFHVPKSFGLGLRERALAELGFIVVQIDGMGWRNLADAGFPDRIAWLRAAAAEHPELDLERVGIFGGSAGGQNALGALLHHGDFYRAAAADCGCHDNRMDKLWWNEAWMGWPVGPHYEHSSNATHAQRLQGKLLLTVGELDRNVDPASTLQVVDALIRADKDFDFVLVPGAGHGIGESPYLVRRRMDFFVRHLWGVEPRLP